MKAAIYARVSTEEQGREGTSLDSQIEYSKKLAQEKGLDVTEEYVFKEIYTGMSLDRPKLTALRTLIRNKDVNLIIAYTLDRLSRDPIHYILLQDEFERAGAELLLVTETLDSSDLGKLITYIKGYAAKLEAEKIKERTVRGRRSRVEKYGKMPTGRGVIYGYTYDKKAGTNIANSCLDTVRMAGMWLLNEGISLNEVCRRLMKMGIPAPKGGMRWSRSTIGRILRNSTYAGKTYVFKTMVKSKRRISRPIEERVELQNVVDKTAFAIDEWEAIQRQLDRNQQLSPRNQKMTYLLRGMVYCHRDGRKYHGVPIHRYPYYRCSGRNKLLSSDPCTNKTVNAQWLEENVWIEVVKALDNPELIVSNIQKMREYDTNTEHSEERIKHNSIQLGVLDEAETRFLRLYGANVISIEKLKSECERIKVEREKIIRDNKELEKQISRVRELVFDMSQIKEICNQVKARLVNLSFKEKRLILEILNMKVWIDGHAITLQGYLPIPDVDNVAIASQPL